LQHDGTLYVLLDALDIFVIYICAADREILGKILVKHVIDKITYGV